MGPSQQQPPDKVRKLYDFLKNNKVKVHKTYDEFKVAMEDDKNLTKAFDYMRDNHPSSLESKDLNSFKTNLGLKKKEPTSVAPATPQDGSQISAPILESGLTEDQEKERNLAQLAQQPPIGGQPTPEQAQNLEFFGGLNAAQILQNQQQDPAIRMDQEKLNKIFSPEAGASQVVRDIAGATEKPNELQQIADNPGGALIQAVGSFNKAVISTASSLPKSVGIIAKKLNDITGLEADKPVEEMATYKLGKWIDDTALELGAVATDPDKADSFWQSTVPGAFGSVVGLMLTGGRGMAGSTAVGGSAMGVSEFEQAKAAGLSDDEAFKVYLKNYLVGTTEALPLQRALPRLNKLSGGKLSEIVKAGAQGGLEEGTQEVVQQYLTNKIAQGSYDPNRDLFQDVLQGGAAGAFVGMFLPGIHAAMQKMTPKQKSETQKILNDEFKQAKSEQQPAPKVDTEVQPATQPEVQQPAIEDASTIRSDQEQVPQGGQVIEGSQNIGGQDIQLAAQQSQEGRQAPAETQQQTQSITDFANRILSGETIKNSDDADFYRKNKEAINEELNRITFEKGKAEQSAIEKPLENDILKKDYSSVLTDVERKFVKQKGGAIYKDVVPSRFIFKKEILSDWDNFYKEKERLKEMFKSGEGVETKVNVNDITPTDPLQIKHKIRETPDIENLPELVRMNDGTLAVVDGHHRIAEQILSGATDIKAKVINESSDNDTIENAPQEAQASAPSETISVGSDIYFDWQGMTKKGKIQEMLPDGRVKIKGSDGTIYRKSLKEVSQREAEIKKAAPKDAEKTVEYNSKRKKPIGIIGDPKFGFMFQTDLGKTISKFFQKQFTAKGFLPRSVFDRWISAKGEISKYESQIKFTTSDLKKAIQEEYGKQLTDAEVTDINLALQGKQPQNPIPPKTQALVQEMRDQIDNLTMRFIDEGVVAGDMADTFTKNLGTYITRSYQKYDDPFWADFVPEEVKNKAMGFLRGKYPGHSNEEMEGLLNYLMYDSDAPMSVMKGGKLGSKDLSILKKRGDIAPEIRALMGEYGDPLLNYARSVTKMAGYIAKHHFLEDVKAQGMNKFLFEKPTGKYYAKISAEGSKTIAPLNGLHTTVEIAKAFEEFNEQEPNSKWLEAYLKINGWVKAGKTIFSVTTHARNFFGNLAFVVSNGHWRLNKAGEAAQVAWANVYSTDKVMREKLGEYIEMGLIQDSGHGTQLRLYIDDIKKGKDFFNRVNESRLKKIKNGILDVTQDLYQFEDDIYKIYAFENEKARYQKAYPSWTEDQVEQKALDIVRSTYPTYSLTPRIVKAWRKFPLLGTFVSFPAEVIRTTWNTAAIAKDEMSNPETRDIGILRMAGLMTALTLPTMASYFTLYTLGMDGDDDNDLKKFVAPWQRTGEFLYLNREGNKYKIIDLGFSDPHAYLKRPIRAILMGDDLTEAGIKAAKEIGEPFLSEELLSGRLLDIARNQKSTGGNVYNMDTSVGDRLKDVYNHIAGATEPGTVRSLENVYKASQGLTDRYGKKYDLQNEIVTMLSGQRQEIKDVEQSLIFRVYEIKHRLDVTENDYYRVTKSKASTEEEIKDAERRYKTANKNILKDAIDLYRSAIRLGVDPKQAKRILYRTQSKEIKKAVRGEK